jgi:hypothetical protein
MFSFRFVYPQDSKTVFHVTAGGRIYVASINVVLTATGGGILDVVSSDMNNGFYHINGLAGDGNVTDYHLLKNTDSGNGLQYFRFTNAHFVNTDSPHVAKIDINRSGSTSGQTVVELVGCRGVAIGGGVLTNNVKINDN